MDVRHKKQLGRILQSVRSHGPMLVQNILDEHGQNPHMTFLDGAQLFQSAAICVRRDSKEDDDSHSRRIKHFQEKLNSFIARKADLIFALEGGDQLRRGVDYGTVETSEAYETFANTPPLEKFLGVDVNLKKSQLFQTLQPGDIVTGKVVYKRPFGIFIKLMDMERTSRDFSDLETLALCCTNEMPNSREYTDPCDAYSVDDVIRAVVISTNPNEDQVLISLRPFRLPPQFSNIQLGILEEGEQSGRAWSFLEGTTYNKHLSSLAGFSNPRNVETLSDILGVNTKIPCSLLRSAQRSFPDSECYEELRKKQTSKWSMETTAKGVELFKSGNTENALKCFKHALEIDPGNVEALVAKGALNANQDRLNMAVQDFHEALAINPQHRNANKYLAETLIAQANELEEEGEMKRAADCYKEILERHAVSEAGRIAAEKLQRIREQLAAQEKLAESKAKSTEEVKRKSSSTSSASEKGQFNHVRQLIKKEKLLAKKIKKKQRKKKKQRSKSKHKKKDRKKHKSSSESSSSESESEDEKTKEPAWIEKTSDDTQSASAAAPPQEKPTESFDQSVGFSQVLFWYESSHRNLPKKPAIGPLNRQDSKDKDKQAQVSKDSKSKGKGDKTGSSQKTKDKKHSERKRKKESSDDSSSESDHKGRKRKSKQDKYASSSESDSSSSDRNDRSKSKKRQHSSSKRETGGKHGHTQRDRSPSSSDYEHHSRGKRQYSSMSGDSKDRHNRSLSHSSDDRHSRKDSKRRDSEETGSRGYRRQSSHHK